MSRIQILLKIIVVISLAFICFRASFISVEKYSQLRNFKYGDSISDKMTLSSARYFFDHGFSETYFRPVHLYSNQRTTKDTDLNKIKTVVYTHYGALPDVLTGAFAVLTGTTNESILRFLPILFSILTMMLFYQLLIQNSVSKNDAISVMSILFISNWFLMWADALNKHVYEFFLLILSLNICNYIVTRRKLNLGLVCAFLIGFFSIHVSYELVAYMAVFYLSMILFNHLCSRFYVFLLMALYLGFIIGFASHIWLNYLVFNDLRVALEDILRAMNVRGSVDISGRINALIFYFQRISIYFYFDWTLLLLSFYFLKKQLVNLRLKNIFYSICIASTIWPLLMPQHVLVHEFTTRWLFLLVVFCSIYFIFPNLKKIYHDFNKLSQWGKLLLVGYFSFLTVLFVHHQSWMTFIRNLRVIFNA